VSIFGNRIDDSFYGVTTNTRNTIKENDVWTYFTDRNGLGDIIQKSNENEAHLFEYRGDKRLSKYTHIQNNIETNNTTYYWDALGRRVAKEIQTPTQTFTNVFAHEGDQDKILLSRNGNGDEYLNIDGQGIDEHLAKITPTEVKSYVTNHLGTVLNSEATDSAKATGAFGEILQSVNTVNSSTAPVVYSLTGREFDLESSTYFFRNRQYDQDSGKFLTLDPSGFNGEDENLYRFVKNAPLGKIDPDGLRTIVFTTEDFFIGDHTAIAVVDDDNGDVVLFDPGGSFTIGGGRPFGGQFFGNQKLLEDFLDFQLSGGSGLSSVTTQTFNTTDAEESAIITGIDQGDVLPGLCTNVTSGILRGAGGRFSNLPVALFPRELRNALRTVPTN
jgi:RHS repeat-associated protein